MELEKTDLKGIIFIFKTLALSRIIFQALIITLPNHVIKELQTTQNKFLRGRKNSIVKHDVLCKSYKQDGLKTTYVTKKILLQYSSIRRLYDKYLHGWKWISLYLIAFWKNLFNFILISHLKEIKLIHFLCFFYKQVLLNWKRLRYQCLRYSCIMS